MIGETIIELTEEQLEKLLKFVQLYGYKLEKAKFGERLNRFGLIANPNLKSGDMKVALMNEAQFNYIQSAIKRSREMKDAEKGGQND